MNAIENATGICIRRIPMTPEDLTAAFEATRENAIA
jgi:CO/xanthine dehydrogenase Mo-binding subunit